MTELVVAVQQALGLVLLLALPVAVAALLGSALAGVLGAAAGLQDQMVALIGRALAVVLAVVLMVGVMAEETRTFTQTWWSELAAVGRGDGG